MLRKNVFVPEEWRVRVKAGNLKVDLVICLSPSLFLGALVLFSASKFKAECHPKKLYSI